MAVPTLRCVLAALVLSACTAGSGPEPAAPESPTRPNFLVIDIDSFGADWLLAERDGARIAPTMTMLASRSQRFTRAISQAGWTLPAAYSLLTGHYPLLLNVVDNTHPAWDGNTRSLAETLGYYGYRSVAYWGHTSLGPNQLGRGFGSTATTEQGDYTVPLSAWIAEGSVCGA